MLLYRSRPRPPRVPRARVLSGNYHQWNDAPFELAQRCEREYYGVADLRFGLRSVYVVTAPELLEEMFTTGHKSYVKGLGYDEASPLFGEGLLTADGDTWRAHRKVIGPFFQPARMDGYGKRIASLTHAAIAKWRDGETRNVYRDMNVLTLSAIMHSFFGADMPGSIEHVGRAIGLMHKTHNRWTYESESFSAGAARFDEFVEAVVDTFRDSERGLVSALLAAHAADPETLTRKHVRDHVATMILSGFETTAAALTWTLYLLARHPRAADAVRDELEDSAAELDELSPRNAPVLYATLCEALRLYPPAHRLSRRAIERVRLGDYEFAAGSDFLIPVWAVHRSSRHYSEPEAFRPERWTAEMRKNLPRFAFMPFGGGPRMCIGQNLAFREMTIIISAIVSAFDLAPAFAGDKLPYNGFTLLPDGGDMQLRLRAWGSRNSRPSLRAVG